MTKLFKWCITLVVCALIAIHGAVQTVAITSSQEVNSSYKMDETWFMVAKAAGYNVNFYPTSILSDSDLRSKADIFIITSGSSPISDNQRTNILQFLQSGGNIYIQSEYLPTLDDNKVFKYLIEKTGSAFEWAGTARNNIGPINVINGFETRLNDNQLDYFWFGTYGCGDGQVLPFIEVEGQYYAFYYRSVDSTLGNLISNFDHDWIRRIS